jgi:hypothetical protein
VIQTFAKSICQPKAFMDPAEAWRCELDHVGRISMMLRYAVGVRCGAYAGKLATLCGKHGTFESPRVSACKG